MELIACWDMPTYGLEKRMKISQTVNEGVCLLFGFVFILCRLRQYLQRIVPKLSFAQHA
jgi:hypothetical protein